MILEAGANDLALVVEIFRTDEPHHTVHNKGIEGSSYAIGSRFERQLIDAVMRLGGKRAALAGFEIHGLRAAPVDFTGKVVRENLFATFAQCGQADTETAIRSFGAGDGLKKQIDRRAALHRGELSADVRKATGLRGNLVGFNQTIQRLENPADRFDGIGGGVHADHRVAAAVEQAFKRREQNSTEVVDRMIRLRTDAENAALA